VAIPWDDRIVIGLAVLAGLLLAIAVWWLWWRLPKQQVVSLKLDDPKARADVEDNFRKTVGQALGGVAVLVGAATAYLQFSEQQRSSHDLLISNQVSKGFEQLGNKDSVVVRLGGIYALEGVMNNSDQYHRPVLEALSAFVREGTQGGVLNNPAPDIQAALTVIGRRSESPKSEGPDLAGAQIIGADLNEANLNGANLSGANLSKANLRDAYLSGDTTILKAANLSGADLNAAVLSKAYLKGTDLSGADLTGAYLFAADLSGANLSNAYLTVAHLGGANLSGANLRGAKLALTDLREANLSGANLDNAKLSGAKLDGQQQLNRACGADAELPPGLTLKPCPPTWPN
jgi:uncharacterized protein YjbI with pentapeptide repeats